MAFRVSGSADDLREALSVFGSIADEYESDGVETGDLWHRYAVGEHLVEEWKAKVRKRMQEAAQP